MLSSIFELLFFKMGVWGATHISPRLRREIYNLEGGQFYNRRVPVRKFYKKIKERFINKYLLSFINRYYYREKTNGSITH